MDNLKTYKVEDNGQMTPMVNVWMTVEQYSWWLEKKAEMAMAKAPLQEQVVRIPFTGKKNGSPHESHAKPHFPGSYKARSGGASMSAQRMEDFLSAYRTHNGDLVKVGRELGIKPTSVSSYKSIAIYNGVLEGTLKSVGKKAAVNNPPIGRERAEKVAELYEEYGDDDEMVGLELGVSARSARVYKGFAKRVGLLK